MIKDFVIPDLKKLITYLLFVILFMAETLFLRTVYQKDYVVMFLLNVYNNFFRQLEYVNFFTISFAYYISVLMLLYLMSCFVIFIIGKIKK